MTGSDKQPTSSAPSAPSRGRPQPAPTDEGWPSLAYVVGKLLFFSALMIACPLGTYYLAFNREIDSLYTRMGLAINDTNKAVYGGVTAVVVANLVITAYVISAFMEGPAPVKKKND